MRIVFLGNGVFGVPTLQALLDSPHDLSALVTRPDRPAGRGRRPEQTPTKRVALEAGLPVEETADLGAEDTRERLDSLGADLWVVVAFPILPDRLLGIPPSGTVNLHASLLPLYRGAAPIQRAIMAGETSTGVTTFFIDAGVDTGAICLQRGTGIAPEETAGELAGRLADIGAQLLIETVDAVARGDAPRIPQDASTATPAPRLRKEEGLIDWNEGARQITDRIRGTHPWPGGHTFMAGERLLVHRSRPVAGADLPWGGTLPAGTVGGFDEAGNPVVASGDAGGVVLLVLQRGGRKQGSGAEVARGLRWQGGERFDDTDE